MRRGRIFIIIAVILIIGLVIVALLAQRLLAPKPSAGATPPPNTVKILIAGQSIPQGEKITEEALGTIEIPPDKVSTAMFTEDQRKEVIGKTAKYPLEQGVVITRSMISEGELALSGPSWANRIPPGSVAVSIPISRLASVAYGATDGAHVNLTACLLFVDADPSFQSKTPNTVVTLRGPSGVPPDEMPGITLGSGTIDQPMIQGRTEVEPSFQQGMYVIPQEQQRPRLVCQTILQDIVVLKLGTFVASQAGDAAQDQPPAENQPQPAQGNPDVVTLVVSPQDANTLQWLIYMDAKLSLSLRYAGDQSRMSTEAATLQFLLSQYNIPIPVKLPYVIEPRVDRLVEPVLKNDVPQEQK